MTDHLIEAAGGVLWRPAPGGPEVALVHRPAYDDWSVPKGKLKSGEHPLLGALREVEEETGSSAVAGRPLGEIRYLKEGRPKRVRYWAMRCTGEGFVAGEEVDRLAWLGVGAARRRVLSERDEPVLARFASDPRPTWPVVVVRHASAGERGAWPGDDDERPLDGRGRLQAEAIADVLAAFGAAHLVSADPVRCLDTLAPYAARAGTTVRAEPLLSEAGAAARPDLTVARCVAAVRERVPVVLCTQRKALPTVLGGLLATYAPGHECPTSLRKGAMCVLHFAAGERGPELVATERFDPPTRPASPTC